MTNFTETVLFINIPVVTDSAWQQRKMIIHAGNHVTQDYHKTAKYGPCGRHKKSYITIHNHAAI